MTVLVTGARGTSRAVLAGLLAAGEPVRASSRAPRPGEFPPASRWRAPTWPTRRPGRPPGGMRKVFLYAHSEGAAEFATAARKAGIEHVCCCPQDGALPGRRSSRSRCGTSRRSGRWRRRS